ncbi:MAG TPA: response regulator [Thermoanaerobaculia bacterium]
MSRKKILLVDDSATVLMMEKFILRNDPYILITSSNGEDAVRKAAAEKPDLILLDAVMPRMSGYEACQLIRDQEGFRDIPILLVAAQDEAALVEIGAMVGCTDFITKPINALELLAKVRTLLGTPGTS